MPNLYIVCKPIRRDGNIVKPGGLIERRPGDNIIVMQEQGMVFPLSVFPERLAKLIVRELKQGNDEEPEAAPAPEKPPEDLQDDASEPSGDERDEDPQAPDTSETESEGDQDEPLDFQWPVKDGELRPPSQWTKASYQQYLELVGQPLDGNAAEVRERAQAHFETEEGQALLAQLRAAAQAALAGE
ncbi:MAG TPA: hypothetical protein VLV83_22225 [Acidobacteriota bacterium]|nr:hypothetical protein [Acidobacteriota bacterium]